MMKFLKAPKSFRGVAIDQADMPPAIKEIAIAAILRANELHSEDADASEQIARDLDLELGEGWLCAVGTSFACNIEHEAGTFGKFSLDSKYYVVYRPCQFKVEAAAKSEESTQA